MVSETEKRKQRLVEICAAFPEVEVSGELHLAFLVRKKTFGYYLDDHHGDGIIALCCKAAPGDLDFLIQLDPDRFYIPSYLGARGWVGVRLDTPTVDWGEIADIAGKAYKLIAPKRLIALMEQPKK